MEGRLQTAYPRWFKGSEGHKTFIIENEIKELEKYWNDLIYTICDGKPSEMAALKKYDIIDFFSYVDNKSKKNG